MQILLVSDLHYTLKQLDWVASVAADYDLVVVAGDLLDIASIVEPDAQIAVVLEYLARIASQDDGRRVLRATTISTPATSSTSAPRGGSSGDARPASSSTATRLETDDVLVTVCPWWDGPRTRDGRRPPARRRRGPGRRPARGSGCTTRRPTTSPTSWTGKRHYGDEELVGVDRPAPSRHRAVRARAPVAVRRRRRLDATASARRWSSTPAGRSARSRRTSRSTPTRGTARVAVARRQSRSARSPGSLVLGVGIALGPSSLRGPGPRIRLPSTTSTMPSPPSWSAYWCLRSAR